MILQLTSSILLFMKKHRSFGSCLAARILIAGFFMLRVPYWLCMAAFSTKQKHSHLKTTRTYLEGAARMARAARPA
jgi:hypothetical protein